MFFLSFVKPLILLSLSLSSSAFALKRSEFFSPSVNHIWTQSQALAGKDKDFAQRALLFHKMYRDSGLSFSFALSVSHLTLAIERSTYNQGVQSKLKLLGLRTIASDLEKWSQGLAKMNRRMFTLTQFIFSLAKSIERGDFSLQSITSHPKVVPIRHLIPPLVKMLRLNRRGQIATLKQQRQVFETFVHWEHTELFQPEIELLAKDFHPKTRFFLENVPGRQLEKFFITPLTGFRTTFSLSCFGNKKPLRTKNFLKASDRIQQARSFFNRLVKVGYNPSLSCYNDKYYVSQFPQQFYSRPDNFLKKLSQNIYSYKFKKTSVTPALPIHRLRQLHPLAHKNRCQMRSSYFKDLAQSLIHIEQLSMQTSQTQQKEWEQALLRNLLINRAYIDLFLDYVHKKRLTRGTWMGSAAFGSATVGHKLRLGFPRFAETEFNTDSDLQKTTKELSPQSALFQQTSQERSLTFPLANAIAHNFLFMRLLSQSNLAVFKDIYWQFLADYFCGPKTVHKLIQQDLVEKVSEVDKKILRRTLKAWSQLSSPYHRDQLQGGLDLLYVEQVYVLQPLLYDPEIASFVSQLGVFDPEAQPGLTSANRPLLDFSDYAKAYNLNPDLTDPQARYAWVSYLILNHHKIFQKADKEKRIEALFSKELQLTKKIMTDYQ